VGEQKRQHKEDSQKIFFEDMEGGSNNSTYQGSINENKNERVCGKGMVHESTWGTVAYRLKKKASLVKVEEEESCQGLAPEGRKGAKAH